MREIKFRGKRTDNGEWVYGHYVKCEWKSYIEDCNNKTMNPRRLTDNDADFRCVEIIPSTVGQYTGLKDKSGVEIYEGDILGGIIGGSVVWIAKEARFGIDVCGETGECTFNDFMQCDLKVIGNIYDNELLEAIK